MKEICKTYARGIQMYDLRELLLSVRVLQQKVLPYSLSINHLLQLPNTRRKYGNESLSFRESMTWNQLPGQYKAAKTDNEFKMKIESWKGFEYTGRICI